MGYIVSNHAVCCPPAAVGARARTDSDRRRCDGGLDGGDWGQSDPTDSGIDRLDMTRIDVTRSDNGLTLSATLLGCPSLQASGYLPADGRAVGPREDVADSNTLLTVLTNAQLTAMILI